MHRSRAEQLVHGVPYKPRNKEPSMFQILSWNDNEIEHQAERFQQNNVNLQNKNRQASCSKENCPKHSPLKPQQLQFNKSPHKIKNELYYYGDEQRKANKLVKEATQNIIKNQCISPNAKKVTFPSRSKSRCLDPNNSEDRFEIENRKKKIKNFKLHSRELPDSAFTTYFGKPAFSNYGSGSKSMLKKTFNIMPHAGSNHPEYQQSYDAALMKGKQIKANYVPKKPIEVYRPDDEKLQDSDYYQIPIKRPNLINTIRFTQDKSYLERKARTPKHNQLNPTLSRQSLHSNIPLKESKKSEKKLKKVTSLKSFQNQKNDHPLVNGRDNLRQILQQNKRQHNKLAYKVTECYPLPYEQCEKPCETKMSRWSEMKAAGVASPRSDHANDVFYWNNIWG